MSLAADIRAMVRLGILRLLGADMGYSQNHVIIRRGLERYAAQSLTESETKAHLAWLEDRGLVTTEVVGRYVAARLTNLGLAVSRGEEIMEGVERPQPDDPA